jgi:gamma-glutamyltranspeptidase/glutathione hydrolase
VTHEIKSSSAAVATSHPEAARAGAEIIRAGGNAVDAAVAAVCTLCVVTPGSVGLAGYGGTMIAYIAREKRVVAIDFDSRAPLAYTPELYENPADRRYSWRAVTVPGVVAGLDLALKKFGTKTWKDVAARALELAEGGFEVDKKLRRLMDEWQSRTDEEAIRSLFPSGKLPEPGETWVQKDHARVIQQLIDQGPDAIYRGEIPREIVRQVQAHGGVLSEEDFVHYAPMLLDPLKISYREYEVFTPPPPSGGMTAIQAMKILEQFDLASLPRWGAEYVHLVAEALKRGWGDRNQYLGDPQFVDVPIEMLLSDERATKFADDIRGGGVANITGKADSGAHTVNVVTADSEGNLVSLTATQGFLFGSQRVAAGLGLILGHGMSRFDYEAGHPNAPAAWKRMHHNMSPTIVLKDGRPQFAFGMPGGTKIVNVTAQIAVSLIDFDLAPAEAIRAPRVHTEGADPIFLTTSIEKSVVHELERMGHQVRREQTLGGPANAIGVGADGIRVASGNGADCVALLSPLPPGEG